MSVLLRVSAASALATAQAIREGAVLAGLQTENELSGADPVQVQAGIDAAVNQAEMVALSWERFAEELMLRSAEV